MATTASNVWSYDQHISPDQNTGPSWSEAAALMKSQLESKLKREKIYFHLAEIFPSDHVRQAMEQLPNETDPQVICSEVIKFEKLANESSGLH